MSCDVFGLFVTVNADGEFYQSQSVIEMRVVIENMAIDDFPIPLMIKHPVANNNGNVCRIFSFLVFAINGSGTRNPNRGRFLHKLPGYQKYSRHGFKITPSTPSLNHVSVTDLLADWTNCA